MITNYDEDKNTSTWVKIIIIFQVLYAIGAIIPMVVWANIISDPSLPTDACPQGINIMQPLENKELCAQERNELYFPGWTKYLFPSSVSMMLISVLTVIVLTFRSRGGGESETNQKKNLRISIAIFGLTILLLAFIFVFPILIAVWIPISREVILYFRSQ